MKHIFVVLGLEHSGKTKTVQGLKTIFGQTSKIVFEVRFERVIATAHMTTASLQELIIRIKITTGSDQERMKYNVNKIIEAVLNRLKRMVKLYRDNIIIVMPATARYTNTTNYDDCILEPLRKIKELGIREPEYKCDLHIIHLKSTLDSLKRNLKKQGRRTVNETKLMVLLQKIELLVNKLKNEGYQIDEIGGNLEEKERAQKLMEIIKAKID